MSYYQRIDREEGKIDGRSLEEGVNYGFKHTIGGSIIKYAQMMLSNAGLPDRATQIWYGREYERLRMTQPMPDSHQVAASDGTDRTLEQETKGPILIEHDGVSPCIHFRKDIAEILTKYGYKIISST